MAINTGVNLGAVFAVQCQRSNLHVLINTAEIPEKKKKEENNEKHLTSRYPY
jgi:hypothetical protein